MDDGGEERTVVGVRRNLDQAKTILEALIKREEKKREVMESEVSLQRVQIKYKHETELLEDSLALPGFPSSSKFASSDDEFVDSDDVSNSRPPTRPVALQNSPLMDIKPPVMVSAGGGLKREFRGRVGRPFKMDPLEPVMLFTKPLDPEKLAAAGIVPPPPPASLVKNEEDEPEPQFNFRGRMGRGGRIVFDRWNPLMHTPMDSGNTFYMPPKPRSVNI